MGGENIAENGKSKIILFTIFLLFIIAIGSASAAEMSGNEVNNTQEDISFDYTVESSNFSDADASIDISQNNVINNENKNYYKNLENKNDKSLLKASEIEVLSYSDNKDILGRTTQLTVSGNPSGGFVNPGSTATITITWTESDGFGYIYSAPTFDILKNGVNWQTVQASKSGNSYVATKTITFPDTEGLCDISVHVDKVSTSSGVSYDAADSGTLSYYVGTPKTATSLEIYNSDDPENTKFVYADKNSVQFTVWNVLSSNEKSASELRNQVGSSATLSYYLNGIYQGTAALGYEGSPQSKTFTLSKGKNVIQYNYTGNSDVASSLSNKITVFVGQEPEEYSTVLVFKDGTLTPDSNGIYNIPITTSTKIYAELYNSTLGSNIKNYMNIKDGNVLEKASVYYSYVNIQDIQVSPNGEWDSGLDVSFMEVGGIDLYLVYEGNEMGLLPSMSDVHKYYVYAESSKTTVTVNPSSNVGKNSKVIIAPKVTYTTYYYDPTYQHYDSNYNIVTGGWRQTDKEVDFGLVDIYDGSTLIGTVNAGESLETSFSATGSHTIKAQYRDYKVTENGQEYTLLPSSSGTASVSVNSNTNSLNLTADGKTGIVTVTPGTKVTFVSTLTTSSSYSYLYIMLNNERFNYNYYSSLKSTTITFDESDLGDNEIYTYYSGTPAAASNKITVRVAYPERDTVTEVKVKPGETTLGNIISIAPAVTYGSTVLGEGNVNIYVNDTLYATLGIGETYTYVPDENCKYDVRAEYLGADIDNYKYKASNGTGSFIVKAKEVASTLTVTPSTTTVYLGDTITLTGTLTGATGDVTYKFSDGTATQTHASGESFSYSPQASGNIRITATSGDISDVLTLHVYPTVPTYIETADFVNRMVQGSSVSITPKVYTFGEVECREGTLKIYIDGALKKSGHAPGSSYTFGSDLSEGTHTVKIVYSGYDGETARYKNSSDTYTIEVISNNGKDVALYGNGVTELYAVKGTSVQFTWNNLHGDKGNSILYENGVQIHSTGGGSASHSYSYTYNGVGTKTYHVIMKSLESNHVTVHWINGYRQTSTLIEVSSNPATIKDKVSISAKTYYNGNPVAGGKISLYVDGELRNSSDVSVSNVYIPYYVTTYYATAKYQGYLGSDNYYYQASSDKTEFEANNIKSSNTTITLNCSSPIHVDDGILITPTVKCGDLQITNGTVAIYVNGVNVANTTSGVSVVYDDTITVGVNNISAKYLGGILDEFEYKPSQSEVKQITIIKYDVNVSIDVSSVVYNNQPVAIITTSAPGNFTVCINGKNYDLEIRSGTTGTVTHTDAINAGNNYQASVTYKENYKYNTQSDSTTFNVEKAQSSVSIPEFGDFKYGISKEIDISHINTTGITASLDSGNYLTSNGYKVTVNAGIPVGHYTLNVHGIGDVNHEDSDAAYEFNVLRVDKVWISPQGTGLGVTEADPTTWDKVADILTEKGTVVFTEGTYNLHDKTVDHPWTITSNGNAIVDAYNQGRIFQITSDNVTVEKLTFKNGLSTDGGAIKWNGENGKLTECNFTDNSAAILSGSHTAKYGGAVYWIGKYGILTDCIFTNNTAGSGGAVYWTGISGDLSDCRFIANNASYYGGALDWSGKKGKVSNCNFENNSVINDDADGEGGAIYWTGNTGTVSYCNFTSNNVTGEGGAIYFDAQATVSHCNFTDNTALKGGAIFYNDDGVINASTFINNHADEYRHIYGEAGYELILGNSTLETFTTVSQVDDGIYNCTRVIAATFDEGTNLGGYEVVLRNDGSDIHSFNSVSDNSYTYTWNNMNVGHYTITVSDSNLKGNIYLTENSMEFDIEKAGSDVTIPDFGNFPYATQKEITLQNPINTSEVTGVLYNVNGDYSGFIEVNGLNVKIFPGLAVGKYTLNVTTVTDENHTQTTRSYTFSVEKLAVVYINSTGGGYGATTDNPTSWDNIDDILVDNGTVVFTADTYSDFYEKTITKPWTITSNADVVLNANRKGTIFTVNSADVTVENLTFANGKSSEGDGGAVYWQGKNGILRNSNFINNTVDDWGGAVHWAEDNGHIINCNFTNNTAGCGGGAVMLDCNVLISDCNFTNNSALNGGALYVGLGDWIVNNCIFTDNIASEKGGAIYAWAEPQKIINSSTFKGNKAQDCRHVYCDGDLTFENNTVETDAVIAQVSDRPYNSSATITATFDEGTNLGGYEVVFSNDGNEIHTFTYESDNSYSYVWNNLNVGDYTITVGDSNSKGNIYITANAPMKFKVYRAASQITINTVADAEYPDTVTVSFDVINATSLTYTVKDKKGNTVVENTTLGMADITSKTIELSLLPGEYTITIANAENANFTGDVKSADFKVSNGTISTLTITVDDVNYPDHAVATVSAGVGGTYVISVSDKFTKEITLQKDTPLNVNIDLLAAGDYTATITSKIANYDVKSADDGFKVKPATSSVTVTDKTFVYATPVEITVDTVNSTGDVKATLTYANGTSVNAVIAVSGNKITVTGLKVGNYTLTVTTNTDENHTESTDSGTLNITKATDSGFYVKAEPRIFDYLKSTVLTPTFKYPVNGNVTFTFDDGTGSVTIKVNETYTYEPKYAGKHNIVAVFSGDDNFESSTRDHVNITVNKLNPNFHMDDNEVYRLVYGQSVTVSTVVDAKYRDKVTGNVTFFFSNGTNRTVKIGESITYTPYKAGDRVLRANYSGDRNFMSGEDEFTIDVEKSDNSGFYANLSPGEIDFGEFTTILGNITNPLAGGNVTYEFSVNHTQINYTVGTPFRFTPDTARTYHFIVKYSGDENFNGHPGIELTLKVNKIDAGFDSTANETSIVYGDKIKINSSAADLRATGTVTYAFDDGTSQELDRAINDVIEYAPKTAGEHTITVRYSGDDNFNEATKTIKINVEKSDVSGFDCVAVPGNISFDQSTTLTSTVSNSKAKGTVTYRFDDGTTLVVRSDKSEWNYVYTPLSAGRHIVNVTYSGDGNFKGKTFNVTVDVAKIDPRFDAYVNLNSKEYLVPYTLYNRFADSRATGNVTYCLTNGTNVTVDIGESVTFTPTYAGEHSIVVKYSGDGNFTNATDVVRFIVTKSDNSGFYVEVKPRELPYLSNTTLKGTLKNGAEGTVTFEFDDGTQSVTVPIGTEYVYTPKWAGKHNITATYNGDDNFNKNTRKINITVTKLNPNFHIDDGNVRYMVYGESVTVRTVVDAKYRDKVTGNVTFFFSNGTNRTVKIGESITYTPYKAGDRVLRANYSGDRNFMSGEDEFTIEVEKSDNSGFYANLSPGEIDFGEFTTILGNITNPLAGGNVTYEFSVNHTQFNYTVGTPFRFTPDTARTYHFIVKYSGDENFNGHPGIELTLKVNKIDAGFDSTANETSIVYGDKIKINSSVVDSRATGTVTYRFDDGKPAELNKDISDVITYIPRSAGYHNITISYSGDTNFKNASKTIRIYVAKSDDSGFNSIADPETIDYLSSTDLISTVTNANARGNVTYRFDDGTTIVIKTDKANWNTKYEPKTAGRHIVNVTYSGDANFNGKSMNVTVYVNKIDAGFDAYTLRNKTVYLDNVILYNKFANTRATGNVTFYLTNGSEVTVNARESLQFMPTFAGEHVISVKYSGDINFEESTDVIKFNITKSDESEFNAFADPDDFYYEKTTNITSTASNGATGNVTYVFDDGTGSVTKNIGEKFVYEPKSAGRHVINATYNGDGNFNKKLVQIEIKVHEIGAGFHINANKTLIVYGDKVLVNSTTLDSLATGNVTYFFDNNTNRTYRLHEAFEYFPLTAGRHVINATYSGDDNFAEAKDSLIIEVRKSNSAGFKANVTPETIPFEGNASVLGWLTNKNATGNVTYHLPNGTDIKKPAGTPITVIPESTDDYHITVDYSGDSNYNGVAGIELTLKVTPIDAGFKTSANETEVVYGDSIKLNSSVLDPLAGGKVTYEFDDGTAFEVNKELSDVIVYTPKSAGSHDITVRYSGDKNFNDDTKVITINVAKSDKSGFGANANPNKISYLGNTTLNAFVTNENATGTVTYRFDDGNVVYTSTEDDWSHIYVPLSAGVHTVNVTYNGNDNFNKASVNVTVTVEKIDSDFDAYTIRPSIVYMDNLTVYCNFTRLDVTGNVTVTFCNGTNKTVDIAEGLDVNQLVKFMPLYAGTHTMNLTYNGDVNYKKATDSVTYTVKKSDNSTFYVECSPRTFSYLDSTTLRGTVKNGAEGTVTFEFDDGTQSLTVPIGTEYVYTPKWAGKHNITATYNGDDNFNKNTRKINITVNKLYPDFHMDDGGIRDLIYGENVTVNTIVNSLYTDKVTGNVTFYFSNGTNMTVKIGESITYAPYKAGNRVLYAKYSGDRNFLSDDDEFIINVAKSDNSGFKASVTPEKIDFEKTAEVLGNVTNPLAGGNVTYRLPNGTNITVAVGKSVSVKPESAGDYHIIVDYNGDDNFKPVRGVELTLKVNKIDAGFNASVNSTETVFENSVKLNSSVSDPLATGNVTYIFDDGTVAELNRLITDEIIYTPKTSGKHDVTVKYSGDKNFNGTTKVITVIVSKSDKSGFDSIADPNKIAYKQSTDLISTVTNPKAKGNVTYRFDDGTEVAVRTDGEDWNCHYTPKTAGRHTVNVTYSGDDNFNPVSINVTVDVEKIDSGFDAYTIRPSIIYLDTLTVYHNFTQKDVTGNVTVTFCNGTNKTVNVNELVKFMPLYAGTHTMTLTYNGDVNYKNATDSITYTVEKSDSSGFYVVCEPRIFSYQDSTTLKGTVKNGADGTVTFEFDDGTQSLTVPIGTEYVYTPKWAGKHNITATYNGDDNFNKNTRKINITVNKINAGFHIKANDTEITFEDSVLLSNVVNNKNATGNVTLFFDDGTNKTVKLSETYVYTPEAGRHIVNATYSGDRNFNRAEDNGELEVLVKKSDNVQFDATAKPEVIPFENSTVLNSTVGNPNATGTVTYHFENGTNVTVAVGTAVAYKPNSTGTFDVNVTYGGDDNFNRAWKIITVKVNPIDAKFNATADNKTPVFNGEIHLNSTVNDTLATGNVTFIFDDGTPEINATIGEVVPYTPKTAGEHTVTVKYSGDKNFNKDEVTITVNVAKAVIDVNVTVVNVNYPDKGKVIVNASVDGDYNVNVAGSDYTAHVINGTGNITVDQLPADEYQVKVTADIANYETVDKEDKLKVSNGTVNVKVEIPPVDYPENITVYVNADVDGTYTVKINGTEYPVEVTGGTGSVTVNRLATGEYPVNVTAEILNYSPVLEHGTASVENGTLDFNVTVVNAAYPENGKVIIENATVDGDYNVTVNGKIYPVKVEKGKGSADIDQLPVSDYPVIVSSNVPNYNTLTKNDLLKVENGTIEVNVTVINARYPQTGKVIVNASVDGDYTVTVNGTDYTAHVTGGTGSADIDQLPADEYPVKVTADIPNYNPVDKDGSLMVSNGTIDINVTVNPTKYPENATVTVNATVDGNYTVKVGNKTYNVTVVNGTGNVTVDQLPSGNHTVNVTSNVPNYDRVSKIDNITVNNGTVSIDLEVGNVIYPDSFVVKVQANVTGHYRFKVIEAGVDEVIELTAGEIKEIDLGVLPVNSYTVNVTSCIENYDVVTAEKVGKVEKGSIDMNITVIEPDYPENATVIVNSTVDGNYTVEVGNRTYNLTVVNGTGNVTVDQLPAGNHTVNVTSKVPNYNETSKETDLTVGKGTIDMNITVIDPTYPGTGKVIVEADVDGNYTVTVNAKDYPVEVIGGRGETPIDQLPVNEYPVNVTSDIENYETARKNGTLTVKPGEIQFDVDVEPVSYPENATVVVKADVDGNYTVTVNAKDYPVEVTGGKGNVTVDVLPAGNYTVNVTANVDNYNKTTRQANLTVNKGTIDINVTVTDPTYPENATVCVNATVDGNYTVEIGNKTYDVTVVNGTGSVTVDQLPAGKHTVNVTGNIENYENVTETAETEVSEGTVDFNVTVENPTYPENATVKIISDVDGNFTVTVNGTDYPVEVINGTGSVEVPDLTPGEYPVTVTPEIPNYRNESKEDTIAVSEGKLDFNVTVVNPTYPDAGKVTVVSDVDGDYIVSVGGKNYTVTVENGTGSVDVDRLPAGEYPVTVTSDVPDYETVEKTDKMTVSNGTIDVDVTVNPAAYPDNATVVINSTVDGNYTVEVNNRTYSVEVVNGTGTVDIPDLPAGDYNITVEANITNYNPVNETSNLTVDKGVIDFNVTVVNPTYPDAGKVTVVSDVDGDYIVSVGGKNYTVTVENGTGSVDVDRLSAGEYPVTVTSDIDNYDKVVKNDTLEVKYGTINLDVKVDNPKNQEAAKVTVCADVDGKYIVEVNDKLYSVDVVNGTGFVYVEKLPAGEYPVKVYPDIPNYENTTKDSEIDVAKQPVDFNVTVDDPTYPENAKVTITSDVDGEFIVEVNGKHYNVTVENGTATVEIDKLPAGEYKVKVTANISDYEATTKETTLTVNPAGEDTVKVKVTLRDSKGKFLSNKKVTFTYNGKTYTVKTNKKGAATIRVKKSDKNTDAVISLKKINGKKVTPIISKFRYSATFKNKNGKAIAGKKVTFKFNGKTYTAKTNKKGVATVTLKNIKAGKYKIVAKCQKVVHKATVQIKK